MPFPSRARRRAVLTGATAAVLAFTALVAVPSAARADTAGGVAGNIEVAFQKASGDTTVSGWIYRKTDPNHYMKLCVWSNGRCARTTWTNIWRPGVNDKYHLRGLHGFKIALPRSATGPTVTIRDWRSGAPIVDLADVSTPGHRIVTWAAKYVGKSPYRSGGATPAGFDCSGYSLYVYREAQVAPSLPHSSNSQRYAPNMRTIARQYARPGDLIFYLSGGSAYHVAIYAGNGMQYAATVPGEKIRYQSIWSNSVEFRTDWH